MTAKIANYVGIAQRAGFVLYGEDIIFENKKKVQLVLVSKTASQKYIERIEKRCDALPFFIVEDLALATHRENVNAIALTDKGLAQAIINLLR